jgi:hydrogenase maturation protease
MHPAERAIQPMNDHVPARILVAGVGNIFWGDDAFGVEVVNRLGQRPLPPDVRVVDFGIRAMDLTYALLEPYEAVILVDAMPRGQAPGTLYVLEPTLENELPADVSIEVHDMNPVKVLRLAQSLGSRVSQLVVVGCEPQPSLEDDEMRMGLSPAVTAVVDEAACLVESLAARLLNGTFAASHPADLSKALPPGEVGS